MKNFFFFVVVFFLVDCHSTKKIIPENKPTGIIIEGNVTGFPDSTKVYLQNQSLEKYVDSTFLIRNRFVLRTRLEQDSIPEELLVYLEANGNPFTYVNLFLRNGDSVRISGDKNDFPFNLKIEGSTTQDEMNELRRKVIPYELKSQELYEKIMRLKPDEKTKRDSLYLLAKQLEDSVRQAEKEYILQHPNTFASALLLSYENDLFPKDTIKMLLNRMSPLIRKSKYGKLLENLVNSGQVEEGKPFYDFTALDPQGKEIRFSDLMEPGKYILLEFTSASCAPCVYAAKELAEINRQYGNKIKIVSFSVDASKETWLHTIKRDSVTWTYLWDGKGRYSPVVISYQVQGVPTFVLISPQGIVQKMFSGYGKGILLTTLKKEGVIE